MKADLPFVQANKNRHGKTYYYFRRPGFPRVKLPNVTDRAAFLVAYNAALAASQTLINAPKPGAVVTLKDCIAAYYKAPAYTGLGSETSKKNYRRQLDRFALMKGETGMAYGDAPAAELRPEHLRLILNPIYAATPSEASNLLKRLRAVFKAAIDVNLIKQDPSLGVKLAKPKTDGHRAWSDEDIEKFRAFHAPGTRARLSLELLIYSGQRRSDIVKMGWQHVKGDAIHLRQKKQGQGGDIIELAIPIHPNLKAELDLLPKGQLMFIMTQYGKPMSEVGFSNWFSECADKAGIEGQASPHGLRKAAARWLAEAGCSASEIAAITGHQSLKDVEHYTKSADQKRLAQAASKRLQAAAG